jgi:hypothetical protein
MLCRIEMEMERETERDNERERERESKREREGGRKKETIMQRRFSLALQSIASGSNSYEELITMIRYFIEDLCDFS